MARRQCPHCRSSLPDADVPETCPRCDRQVGDGQGRLLRPLDVDYDGLKSRLDANAWRKTKIGTGIALGVSAFNIFIVTTPFVMGILFLGQLLWIRIAVIAPYRKHFTPTRRIVTRWLSRIVILKLAVLHVPAGLIPFGRVLLQPLLFGSLCLLAWGYHRWHLDQERNREPVSCLEKAALGLAVVVALLLFTLLIVAVVLGASMIEAFRD